ncbi:MAG: Ku protein [Clostridiales bacterium]|nr:Ku protein [Clostridiales bacterium]MCF8022156.1 Ku protein [Clostridiales bacterium]
MRPLWKGAVSLGLIYVPVKMYAATERKDIRFNYLHEKCKNPVKSKKYCPYCDEEVAPDEIVKGYQYEKGKYVVIRDEDFENIPGETTKSIDIMDFVDISQIDPVYYDKPYFLVPGEGGEKVYELLKRSMNDTKKVAVARVIIRSKESLASIRVVDNVVLMSTMHYPDEVRDSSQLEELKYNVNIHNNELKMAVNLIESLSGDFEPSKYNNEYRKSLMEMIQAKIAGEEVEEPAQAETEKVVDLMSALKASIDKVNEENKGGEELIESK